MALDQEKLKKQRCCIVMHEEDKTSLTDAGVCAAMHSFFSEALQTGYRTFLFGFTNEIEYLALEELLSLEKDYSAVNIAAVLAYPGCERRMSRQFHPQQNTRHKTCVCRLYA